MIIECKTCSKKFVVNDADIPDQGRVVQCGNCSTQWLQLPISESTNILEKSVSKKSTEDEVQASDGKKYKFLGKQWAEVLPSGKTGRLAKSKIRKELDELTNRTSSIAKKRKGSKEINTENDDLTELSESKGMGIFSFLFVTILFFASILLLLDTFKNQIIPYWPDLENYLIYIFETINNIYIIIKDLINNYK